MTQIKDTLTNYDVPRQELPSLLNVLTILTFIGSGLATISLIMNFFQDCDAVLAQLENLPEMGGFFDKIMNMSKLSLIVMCENKMLISFTTAVGITLCIVGAAQMRQLKKQGFIFYLVGEFIAPVVLLILSLSSMPWLALSGFIVPIIMAILYATQQKYLVH